jgi:hypothetical protein
VKITNDVDELLAFYDYPAEHWIHLRTTPSRARGLHDLRHSGLADRDRAKRIFPTLPAPSRLGSSFGEVGSLATNRST